MRVICWLGNVGERKCSENVFIHTFQHWPILESPKTFGLQLQHWKLRIIGYSQFFLNPFWIISYSNRLSESWYEMVVVLRKCFYVYSLLYTEEWPKNNIWPFSRINKKNLLIDIVIDLGKYRNFLRKVRCTYIKKNSTNMTKK